MALARMQCGFMIGEEGAHVLGGCLVCDYRGLKCLLVQLDFLSRIHGTKTTDIQVLFKFPSWSTRQLSTAMATWY
jgi:hypothetical protein